MNVLSLFDGMSCGQIALNRIGIKPDKYFASEIDKYAIKITQKNYPDTIQIGDITNVSFNDGILYTENGNFDVGEIDLLMGGSPCQGFSFAGKQLNFEDERSKLFFEFVRILKECNPAYFLLENVKMKKEYQDVISEYLNVEPILINSALVSAQNRKRLYWTNIKNVKQPEDRNLVFNNILDDISVYKYRNFNIINDIFLSGDYIRVRTKKSAGQANTAILPDKKSYSVCCNWKPMVYINNKFRYITEIECERLQTVPDNYTEGVPNTQRYNMLGNGWTVDVICHILKNMVLL